MIAADHEQLLRRAYDAFNTRNIDTALALMHDEVDWPNLLDGRREQGRAAVRAYWARQLELFDPRVEPQGFTVGADGRIAVEVHQIVRDAEGRLIADQLVEHVYAIRDGLIERMDVREG